MKSIYFFLLYLFLFADAQAQTVYHVNLNIQGGQQTGLDWVNAIPTIQAALTLANQGDEIWVAKGVYYPTTTTDRAISIVLKQGVKLYGGFTGSETTLEQRNFAQNETILSGNIGDPTIHTDNSYNIVTGQGLDSATCLDGFILRHAYANGPGSILTQGGALTLKTNAQAPLTCPLIRNCRFEYNYTTGSGAGLSCQWNSDGVVCPVLQNCRFQFNVAQQSGGAVFKRGPSPATHPFRAEGCIFNDNRALYGNWGGGGVYLQDPSGTIILRRCIFERDSALGGMGGALYYGVLAGPGVLQLDSCIFRDNRADDGAGFAYDEIDQSLADNIPFTCRMNACIFEKNVTRSGDGAAFIFYALDNSLMQLYVDNCIIRDNRNNSSATCSFESRKNSNVFISVRNSLFIGNLSTGSPNNNTFALNYGTTGKCRAVIENCIFARNGAGISGLIANSAGGCIESTITNCTFFNNGQFIINKSWSENFNDSTFYDDMYISNCIFWERTQPDRLFSDNNFMTWQMDGYFIDHVLVNQPKNLSIGLGPNVLYETYPMFADTQNYDFRLLPCSPAVNFGTNQAVAGMLSDISGNPRIFGDTVDLGAHETQDSCALVSAVDPFLSAPDFRIYPNPSPEAGMIKLRSLSGEQYGDFYWKITDINGRLLAQDVWEPPSATLQAPGNPGIYTLIIGGKNYEKTIRFVVVPAP